MHYTGIEESLVHRWGVSNMNTHKGEAAEYYSSFLTSDRTLIGINKIMLNCLHGLLQESVVDLYRNATVNRILLSRQG